MLKRGALRMERFQVQDGKPLPDDRRVPDPDLQAHANKHICFGVQSVDAAERELRDNSGNLIEFIEQPDLW
jgi:methylmalonyl-CoA/ethylmalonyl-CoA epimerase